MMDATFYDFIKAFMEQVAPVVPLVPGISLPQYKQGLMERFANPTINDRIARLCSEGSAKMPKWVVPSVVELAEKRSSTKLLGLVIAAWIKYLQSPVDERGAPIEVVDARAEELTRALRSIGNDPRDFLDMKSLFGAAYFSEASFANEVHVALKSLSSIGAKRTIRQYIGTIC